MYVGTYVHMYVHSSRGCVLVFVTCRIVRESMRLARLLPRESVHLASS